MDILMAFLTLVCFGGLVFTYHKVVNVCYSVEITLSP